MSEKTPSIIALLYGPDQPGLVARVSNWIYERGGNIIHADQHTDIEEGIFFQRVEWSHTEADLQVEAASFRQFAEHLNMRVRTALSHERPRVCVMVSKIEHCFHDILVRWKMGEINGDIALILSNHEKLRGASEGYGVPFEHIPVDGKTKEEAEKQQLAKIREHRIDLIVMARYMQVLSDSFLEKCGCPVINIHHSFLPAFAGAKPYHQAFKRGVKLIGATAHYATADLDEGPIIQQGVANASHRHNVSELIRKGRDLEKTVFAQAIRWHLEHRILVYSNKTVVFD